jgi:hypothetical protein
MAGGAGGVGGFCSWAAERYPVISGQGIFQSLILDAYEASAP